MNVPASSRTAPSAESSELAFSTWSLGLRVLVSLLLAVHIFAVFVAPWSSPPPSSDLSRWFADRMYPFLSAVSIDNGYRFFAPDPGPSHLIRYEIDKEDGSTVSFTFPDPERHWPRLWYHRQFMLAETLAGMFGELQSIPPPERLSREERRLADAQFQRTEVLKGAVGRYLLAQHPDGKRIRLFVRRHLIPAPEDLASGMQIDDEKLYEEYPFGEYVGGTP